MEEKDLIGKLNLSGKRLSKGHRRIADYIEQHYDKAVFMTASVLGDHVGVSESTVVRFAMALGYDGYPEMQKALQEQVRHRLTSAQRFEMSSDIDKKEVLSRVLKADMHNIRLTIDESSTEDFSKAVESILPARTIYVLGLRSAAPLSQFLGYYLHFMFDDVRVVAAASTDVFESIARIRKDDVLIGISFPRYSSRTIEAMRFARQNGATVIGISDGAMSPLTEHSDVCLCAHTDMASFVDSLVAPLSVINALLIALALEKKEEVNSNFERLEEIWGAHSVYAGRDIK
ncbi:MAG: N-acetylmannosamine kinase [Clostridiales bacterium]|nr:N-acetylmannosamine kinase [Clostridiales bacterium]